MRQPTNQRRRKAPKNCEWRGGTLYGRKQIKGVLRRWSLRTGDADVARARVEEDIARLTAGAYYGDARISCDDAVASWAETRVHEISPNTAKRYFSTLSVLKPFLAGKFVDEINTKEYMKGIVDQRRAAGGVKTATIRRDLTVLAGILEFLDVDENHARIRSSKLKERRDPIVLPDEAHVARIIARTRANMAILVAVARKTGCRLEELVSAERTNVDHARQQLTIRGKRNKVRVIDLRPFGAYEDICRIPPMLGCKWLFWHGRGLPYKNLSSRFAGIVGTELRASERVARAAGHDDPGFRKFRFHDLRHLHAVEWLKSGRSIYDLQGRLGHASIKTTEIYLAFLTPEEIRAVKYGSAAMPEESQKESRV